MNPYYEQDGITIYHGDCRDILPALEPGSVDLVLTDPPYGVGINYISYEDSVANWKELMGKIIPLCQTVANMVIMPSCQIKMLPWIYRHHPPDWLIAWHKGSPGHVSAIGFNDWEPLLVYGRTRGLSMHDFLSVTNNEKMGSYGHPCPKPVRWATWLISRACPDGGVVLDPFLGSGTTLRAAKDLGRMAIGIEIEERYCEIAARRLAQGVFDWPEIAAGASGGILAPPEPLESP